MSSFTDHVDAYPDAAFDLLLLLYGDVETIKSADLLTNPFRKAQVLLRIARSFIAQPGRRTEGLQVCEQAYVSIQSINGLSLRAIALRELGQVLIQANQWQKAQEVITSIQEGNSEKAEALSELGLALAQANQEQEATQVWQQAQEVIASSANSSLYNENT